MKKKLPCKQCIVFPICKSKINGADIRIFKVIDECSLIKNYLEIIRSSMISVEWADSYISKQPIIEHRIIKLTKFFAVDNKYLSRIK